MAGHSHWAGIKHKKGKADKQRLRSAIQSARSANMPKENIERAIDKSTNINSSNFQSMRYEGFGPKNIAVIVEALTDNKNRTASKIRTIFQKNGGSLGSSGSASHNFKQIGVIKIPKNEISEEKILDIAIDAGAEECHSDNEIHEIHCEKNKIYEVKKKLEMTVKNFISTEIEWIPINNVIISKDIFDEISDFLDSLDNDDDVQNIFTNLKIGSN